MSARILWLLSGTLFLTACEAGEEEVQPQLRWLLIRLLRLLDLASTLLEGGTSVATLVASDSQNDSLSFSIASARRRGTFLDHDDGCAVVFATAPDFEAPGDSDTDNVYDVTVPCF